MDAAFLLIYSAMPASFPSTYMVVSGKADLRTRLTCRCMLARHAAAASQL